MTNRNSLGVVGFATAWIVIFGLLTVAPSSANEPAQPHAKTAAPGSEPTAAEADAFIANSEEKLFDLAVKAQRAAWVQENFITDDTEQIAADAGEAATNLTVQVAKEAHRYDHAKLSPVNARKLLLLELAIGFPAPADPKESKELAQVEASLDGDYGKGKWCTDGANANGEKPKCLDVTAVRKLMANSRDPAELKRAWVGWHAVGAPMR